MSLCKVTLIKLPNMQISYKGKNNTYSHSQGLYSFINYELHAILNDLNWNFQNSENEAYLELMSQLK